MNDQFLSQASTRAEGDDRWVDPRLAETARTLAARGAVLLANDNGTLPLAPGSSVAVFGRVQKDWVAVGYGSGGDVNAPYVTNLVDSLREDGRVTVDPQLAGLYETWCRENPVDPGEVWGAWPRHFEEMRVADDVVRDAAARNETAVIVVGRAAGEDRDNVLEAGGYYLTEDEKRLLAQVTEAFDRTAVVIDAGNVIDLSWAEDYPISALLLAWAGGMEGGRAIADVLTGAVEPGGRLTDTIARRYEDYPSAGHFGDPEVSEYVEDIFVGYRYFESVDTDAVLFPFGHGLGYSTFTIDCESPTDDGSDLTVRVSVTNTGTRAGSEVVQVYLEAPNGALSRPARELIAFGRTATLDPGESAQIVMTVPLADLASYDETGATGHRSAWVLEAGEYRLHVGRSVRETAPAGSITLEASEVVRQLEEVAAVRPEHSFERMTLRRNESGEQVVDWEAVPTTTVDLRQRILDRLPAPIDPVEDQQASFRDVLDGSLRVEDFVARLTPNDLASLAYGDIIMDSPLGTPGNAGALGGVTESLRARGIPAATTTDGPSGLRLSTFAALLPCGTALASTWDPAAIEELAALHGEEMVRKGSHILLSPGMNIHRDPLCGRNFEYFAEDPLLSGRMAAAIVRGVQSRGVAACPKHFAANNQETNRIYSDSRVSERALREIYLRGFEICIREADPWVLMTSYNKINGIWGHYHYDLVTTVLRKEWEWDGLIVTDWWMRMAQDPDFPALRDSAYRVRAQVDVLMPGSITHGGTEREDAIMDSYAEPDGITLGEMQRTALNVLRYLQRSGLGD
ncbi:MAG: glycoside hydrolase family 3 C-terminal domain-containing protein [Brachybacterium sp.]|nr:glycoside hydrolase family 3 C-terminal domain-containing protein [Brachybacterium sp.]